MKQYILLLRYLSSFAPMGRYRWISDWSAQEFYEDYLEPAFEYVVEQNATLVLDVTCKKDTIILDDVDDIMYPTDDEIFGRLYLRFGEELVRGHLVIKHPEHSSKELVDFVCKNVSTYCRNLDRENKENWRVNYSEQEIKAMEAKKLEWLEQFKKQ